MNRSASIPFSGARQREGHTRLQRWGALAGGGALAVIGLTRRSAMGAALAAGGGALAYFAATAGKQQQLHSTTSVLVNASQSDAYRFWHNFEEFPLFMHHIESVNSIGNRRYRWVALGPLGARVTWDAEVTQDREGEVIAWHSLPGSDITVNGEVRFGPSTGNRGTVVSADIRYSSPGGAAGKMLFKLMGKDPKFLMEQDMRRFKALIETGETPTVEGQTHGPRSFKAGAARIMDPDRPVRPGANVRETIEMNRRVS
jgi:uncharacterized membrane protein